MTITDWRLITLMVLIGSSVVILWIITIKDIVNGVSYLKSQKETDRTNKNENNDNPEPDTMTIVETHNLQNNAIDTRNNKQQSDKNSSRNSSPHSVRHSEDIIK